jgi:transposase
MRFVKQLAPDTISLLWRIYKHSKRYRVRQRAHCILLSSQGITVPQLARMFHVTQRTVYNWLNAWEMCRFPGIYDASGKGRQPKLTSRQKEQIQQWAKKFPKNLNKIIVFVKEEFDIIVSKSTIKRVLKEFTMSWRRIRRRPKKKPDAKEYTHKKQELETFKKQEDQEEIDLYDFDESGFCLESGVPYAWQEKGQSIEIPTGKGPRLNVVGFLSRKHKLQTWTFEASVNSDVVIACIDAFCKTLTKRTVLVIDNASLHTSDAVEEKRTEWKEDGLELFFLPPYSPQLSIIEILWRCMKYEWIDFDAYKGWKYYVEYIEEIIIHYGTKYVINFE